MDDDFAAQVSGVGALAEPVRRAALPVRRRRSPSRSAVTRPRRASASPGTPRSSTSTGWSTTGLLDTEFRRLSGRRGPGAGRPTKLYRRADREISVTLPERHYELAGADARRRRRGVDAHRRPGRRHRHQGRRGRRARSPAGSRRAGLARLTSAHYWPGFGYEPRVEGGDVVLANCPFHTLARDHTALVCGMNLHLLTALLEPAGPAMQARLDPAPGRCCVVVGPA